ncbi:phosphoribosyltransferase domain-containing protein [uncultured Thiodictyon sp.]|uniref:phosphoribosyltransferase domain-containing protein n=1 Tax=uncultured Thiodictyon sp. TaxID=1846217 RepID=UPI002600AD21|nr:phosphoribosyltransferase domain-containing protein [uncultured Thiodictyon sp.]
MNYAFDIPGGTLRIATEREELPLSHLLGFAARANPRRPFLFVSKVLGRHIPCRPQGMRDTYRRLSAPLLDAPGPVWVIGMAETATGLGAGVADSLARANGRTDIGYQHTTRRPLAAPPLLTFEEAHSHAPTHLLHRPLPALAHLFEGARTLVIVDDEVSTGQSVKRLAEQLGPRMPKLEQIVLASLVNWLGAAARERIARDLGGTVRTRWCSLLDGQFAFEPDAGAVTGALPADVEARQTGWVAREDLGRRGLHLPPGGARPPALAPPLEAAGRPLTIIGTGECAFAPFLAAEALELAGRDVTFQTTSRSPVLLGGAVARTAVCPDPYGEGVGYYLHNPPGAERLALALYEEARACNTPHPGLAWQCMPIPGALEAAR